MIEIKNLSKQYDTHKVLQDINLTLEPGKVYGVIGLNGAGKTTLIRCIVGLEIFDGEIHSDFQPLKNSVGYLMSDPYFLSMMTGKEYIQLLCTARSVVVADIENKNIFDLPLHSYAESYSTGMKKKLAMTAILLQRNSVYILDEPFNGVDIEGNIILIEIIKALKQLNKTLFISSHLLSTLKDICDVIFLLQNGTITKSVEKDRFDDLDEQLQVQVAIDIIKKMSLG